MDPIYFGLWLYCYHQRSGEEFQFYCSKKKHHFKLGANLLKEPQPRLKVDVHCVCILSICKQKTVTDVRKWPLVTDISCNYNLRETKIEIKLIILCTNYRKKVRLIQGQ